MKSYTELVEQAKIYWDGTLTNIISGNRGIINQSNITVRAKEIDQFQIENKSNCLTVYCEYVHKDICYLFRWFKNGGNITSGTWTDANLGASEISISVNPASNMYFNNYFSSEIGGLRRNYAITTTSPWVINNTYTIVVKMNFITNKINISVFNKTTESYIVQEEFIYPNLNPFDVRNMGFMFGNANNNYKNEFNKIGVWNRIISDEEILTLSRN